VSENTEFSQVIKPLFKINPLITAFVIFLRNPLQCLWALHLNTLLTLYSKGCIAVHNRNDNRMTVPSQIKNIREAGFYI